MLLSVTWKTLPVKDYFKINFFELCKLVCTHKFSGWYYPLSLNATVERRKYLFVQGKIHLLFTYTVLAFGVPHPHVFLLLGMLCGQDLGVLSCASHPTQPSNLRTKARTGAGLSAGVPPFMLFQVPIGSPISYQFSSFF